MAEETEVFSVVLDARMANFEKAMLQSANRTDAALHRIQKGLDATNRKTRNGLQFRGLDARGDKALRDLERRFNGLRGTAMGGLAALGISFGASQLLQDLRQEEEAARRLEAVLKSTGHAAGLSQKEIAEWADALERRTGRSAAEIQTVAAQLATFTSIGRKEFLGAIEVADDLAATFGGDLQSNLDAVARALDDPIAGFANLKKRGFALSEEELNRAKAHLKAGESAKAQGVVLDNLSRQVKGAAEATNQGLTKALNDLRKEASDTFKALADGGGTEAVTKMLNAASGAVKVLGENIDLLSTAATYGAVVMSTKYGAALALSTKQTLADTWAKTANVAVIGQQALAARALSAAIVGQTATATAATVAFQGMTLATRGAATAMALMGGPVGVAILAVAALSLALFKVAKAQTEAAQAAKAQAKAKEALAPANTELEKLTRKLATANDAETASIRRKIDALISEERIKAQMKRQDYLEAKEVERKKVEERRELAKTSGAPASAFVDAYGQSTIPEGGIGPNGNPIDVVRETSALMRLRVEAETAEEGVRGMVEAAQEAVVQATTPIEFTSKPDKSAAKAAEQRKRLLEDLKAQTALEVAQLDEQVAKVRELERQAEITARIRQLEDAGFKAAQARAISGEVQTKLDEARARAMDREGDLLKRSWDLDIARLDENWETVRAIEAEVEKRELVAALAKVSTTEAEALSKAESMLAAIQSARVDAAKRGLDLAREEHRLAVAQLSGNRQLTKELQDQAAIRDRASRYQQEFRLKPAEAERRATEEVTRERAATTYGEHKQLFATAFSDGIRAAMAGDLQGFLSNQFGNFADKMMQKAGEQLFDSIFGGVSAVTEGAAQGAAVATAAAPGLIASGASSGAALAASAGPALIAAGAAAGQAYALAANASKAFSFLPGFSAGGYTGPGGVSQPRGVVHAGEVVFSQRDVARHGGPGAVEAMRRGMPGYANGGIVGRSVLPGVNAAMNRVQGAGRQPIVVEQHLHNDFKGAVMTDELLRDMDRKAAMAQAGAVAQVASASAEQQRKSRYRTRGT